jgi:hypothetical protein
MGWSRAGAAIPWARVRSYAREKMAQWCLQGLPLLGAGNDGLSIDLGGPK